MPTEEERQVAEALMEAAKRTPEIPWPDCGDDDCAGLPYMRSTTTPDLTHAVTTAEDLAAAREHRTPVAICGIPMPAPPPPCPECARLQRG